MTCDAQGHAKFAQKSSEASASSYFMDGARSLDVKAVLAANAEKYAISDRPEDYYFEVIRANTTNAPNQNNDAFHAKELLRYNVRLARPVYRTYEGKPHHVDHKTDVPTDARGIIIDAAYNDSSPALKECPACAAKTHDPEGRDEDGLHCKKCGTLVKDEFVEILVGIDSKKDKRFAEAVRQGILSSGSMGCNCRSTTCNVCEHVAYTKHEFCDHIKRKGRIWQKQGSVWVQASPQDIKQALGKSRYNFVPNDFMSIKGDGFEFRKGFEFCNDVVFEEYSRVHDPADRKARQIELLKAASVASDHDKLAAETEDLIRRAQGVPKMATTKKAERFYVIRVNKDDADTHAAPSLERALELALPDPDDVVEYGEVEAPDAGAARLNAPPSWKLLDAGVLEREGVGIQLKPGDDPVVIEAPPEGSQVAPPPGGPAPGAPGAEEMPPGAPSIDELGAPPPADEMGLGEMGVMPAPPGASYKGASMFKNAYRGWKVQVSGLGNAQVVAPDGAPVLVIRGNGKDASTTARRDFGRKILASLRDVGLVDTAKKYAGIFSPKFAQVAEGGLNDMQGFDDHELFANPLDGLMTDKAEEPGKPPKTIGEGGSTDKAEEPGKPPKSTDEGGAADHDRPEGAPSSVTDDAGGDMREPKGPGPKSVLDDGISDRAARCARTGFALGARVAHTAKPDKVFRIVSAAVGEHGLSYVVQAADVTKKVSDTDLLAYWKALDATADAKFADRVQRAAAAKVAKAKAEVEAARAEALGSAKTAQTAGLDAFVRALKIAAKRQEVDLEPSPLKLAAEAVLAEPRVMGRDPATGVDVPFDGLNFELARRLTAELWTVGMNDEIDSLVKRAKELMTKGDSYLLDAEADAANLKASLPPITASAVYGDSDPDEIAADQLRRAAKGGNMNFRSGAAEPTANDYDTRLARALGGTIVAKHRARLGR